MSDWSSDVCSSDLRRRAAGRDHRAFALDQAGELLQPEPPRDETRDRAGVVDRVIDLAVARVRRDDERRDARARPPAIALGRRDMIPPAAILVEGDADAHLIPLRALLQRVDHSADMSIAGVDIRIAGVPVAIALRLV